MKSKKPRMNKGRKLPGGLKRSAKVGVSMNKKGGPNMAQLLREMAPKGY